MSSKFTHERFVAIWMQSSSVKEVARKLRVSTPYVHQIATQLRKEGVKLKKMARGRQAKKIDVEALNQIVESNSAESEEPAVWPVEDHTVLDPGTPPLPLSPRAPNGSK